MGYEHKNDDKGVWRTIGGRRIFIADGEDLETAMKKSGKFKPKKEVHIRDYKKGNDGKYHLTKAQYEEIKNSGNGGQIAEENSHLGAKGSKIIEVINTNGDKKLFIEHKDFEIDDESSNKLKYEDMTETDKLFVKDAVEDTIREWKKAGDLSLDDIRVNDVIRTLNSNMKGFMGENNEDAIKQHIAILMKKYHIG